MYVHAPTDKTRLGFGFKANATFTSVRGNKPVTLVMRGKFRNKTKVTDKATGAVVGVIRRKHFNWRTVVGQQTYSVTVAPGVDMALLAAMGICLDEMQNEGKNQSVF